MSENLDEAIKEMLRDEIAPALDELGLKDHAQLGVVIDYAVERTIQLCTATQRAMLAEVQAERPNRAARRKKPPRGQRGR
jgi:hypothetical protein